MKKLFACVLALAMAAAMAAPALAEESSATTDRTANVAQDGDQTRIPVHATYKGPQDVVSVDIVWDAMDFTYISEDAGTWDPTKHTYTPPTNTGWNWNKPEGATEDNPKITLTNHSNIGVNAVFGFDSTIDGLVGTFSPNACSFARAKENSDYSAAPSDSTSFSLDGAGIDAEKDLGNITVTISKGEIYETLDDLQAAIVNANSGDTITLGADIIETDRTNESTLNIPADENIVLDLNKHTISIDFSSGYGNCVIYNNSTLTIKNGTIIGDGSSSAITNAGTLTADGLTVKNENGGAITSRLNSIITLTDCTLYSGEGSLYPTLDLKTDARIVDCTITRDPDQYNKSTTAIHFDDGQPPVYTLTFGGNIAINNYITTFYECNIVLEDGCNFAPESHVDQSICDVTQNTGTRTWTVTYIKQASQD